MLVAIKYTNEPSYLLPSQRTPSFFSILVLPPFFVFAFLALLFFVPLFIAISLLVLSLRLVPARRSVSTP
jgi:hypothetical protein